MSVTREEIQGFLLNAAVGLASIAVVVIGGEDAISWAGYIYLLAAPLQITNGRLMSRRRRKKRGALSSTAGEGEAGREGEEL